MAKATSERDFTRDLHSAQSGDLGALNRLLERLRPVLRLRARGLVERRLGRRVDTSDVVQEAMIQVNRDAKDFRGGCEAEWRAWAHRILRGKVNRLRRFHRAAKRDISAETITALLSTVEGKGRAADDQLERNEQLVRLGLAIESLPEAMRQVVVGRVVHREPFQMIAQRLQRSTGATRVLWTRALRKLRTRIDQP